MKIWSNKCCFTLTKKISTHEYELQIPNYEIKTIFQRTILEWLEVDVKLQKTILQDTIKHLINNRIDNFEVGFKAIIGDEYIIKSNRKSGQGRYDIMLVPRPYFMRNNKGVVIEIKQIQAQMKNEPNEKFHNRINSILHEASNQIIRSNNINELKDYWFSIDQIVVVPIVFAGKAPFGILL